MPKSAKCFSNELTGLNSHQIHFITVELAFVISAYSYLVSI